MPLIGGSSKENGITMDEFLERMEDTIADFVEATKKAAETDDSMDPTRRRPEAWWWRDVAAYINCKKLAGGDGH